MDADHKERCETCRDLDWGMYPVNLQDPTEPRYVPAEVASITKSAETGCELCNILDTGIRHFSEKLGEKAPELADELESALVLIFIQPGQALRLHVFGEREYADYELLQLEFYTNYGWSNAINEKVTAHEQRAPRALAGCRSV